MDSSHCAGCEDNFYNGNNPYGINECWNLKKAKLINRIQIHIDQFPPYKQKPKRLPNCYRVKRYSFVSPDTLDPKGYWRS